VRAFSRYNSPSVVLVVASCGAVLYVSPPFRGFRANQPAIATLLSRKSISIINERDALYCVLQLYHLSNICSLLRFLPVVQRSFALVLGSIAN